MMKFIQKTRVAILVLLIVLISSQNVVLGYDVNQINTSRTKDEILQKWLEYLPMGVGFDYMNTTDIYEEKPNLEAPYSTGKLKKEYILDGIKATNFVRYLAGLPDDIEPDWSLEFQQQAASLVNAANNRLTHFPEKPAGMEDELFRIGYAGTSSSNLFAGDPTLYSNVLGYMADTDLINIDRVGHRRWIINPVMKKTMFGFVHTEGKYVYPYASMYAFNRERSESEVSYEFVSWPSAGYFPEEVFAPQDAWSVSLNPKKYDNKKVDRINVTLTRKSDGKTWSFDKNDTDKSGKYFNVDTQGYGIPYCIIFRPDGIESFKENDVYSVKISGIFDKSGNSREICFETTFFNLVPNLALRPKTIKLVPGEKLKLGYYATDVESKSFNGIFESKDKDIVSVDSSGNITANKVGQTEVYLKNHFQYRQVVYVNVVEPSKNDRVSSWALNYYEKAKGNGNINVNYDDLYQMPIYRYTFTVLALQMYENVLGEQSDNVKSPFKDINDIHISKAYSLGLISGTSKDKFSPWKTITRQEAATLILNVYNRMNAAMSKKTQQAYNLDIKFADDSKIASWAKNNVYTAANLGLINGVGGNRYDPLGALTREQTFVLLEKLFERFVP